MMDQKNLVIAIALSIAILLGFQYFFEQPKLQREQAEQVKIAQQQRDSGTPAPATNAPSAPGAPGTSGAPPPGGAVVPPAESRADALKAAPRVKIETAKL